MIRRHPISTLTDTLFPYTTLFRSHPARVVDLVAGIADPDDDHLVEAARSQPLNPARLGEGTTLRALAHKIGVDPGGLERTVSRVNELARSEETRLNSSH